VAQIRKSKKLRYFVICLAAGVLLILPSYFRLYRVYGSSDAPSYLRGDYVLVNRAAYDVRLPFSKYVLFTRGKPVRGDVVMFRFPERDYNIFKRVLGLPGDLIEVNSGHLKINGRDLKYQKEDSDPFAEAAAENNLGTDVETESGEGLSHLITYSPKENRFRTFAPTEVPKNHYYVVGDNRDSSLDSRIFGAVRARDIVGRVSKPLRLF